MMRNKGPHDECCGGQVGCGEVAVERNRYFTGKYMAARDFQDEQTYFLSRHRLHNRLLHGWGIVCGLRVSRHPNPDCRRRWVILHPGIALDCCGRELVVECETPFELPLPRRRRGGGGRDDALTQGSEDEGQRPDEYSAGGGPEDLRGQDARREVRGPHGQEGQEEGEEDAVMREPFLLALRYVEDESERVPALYNEGGCDPARREANRIRERAELVVVRLSEVEGNCWLNPEGDPEAACRDDCADELPGPGRSCLDPVCPCGHVVPLALITPDPDRPGEGFEIDLRGRRYLPTPPELLTHIVDVNWPHGGEVTLDELINRMKGQLEVRFDRKLLPSEGDANGINPFTFVVQYGGVQRDIEFLPPTGDDSPTVEDDCRAIFRIDRDYINPKAGRRGATIVGNVVYVTLKCDFILDCHRNPVDGNFLRGRFPTGDGQPGGVFESWFRVVFREEDERWQQRV